MRFIGWVMGIALAPFVGMGMGAFWLLLNPQPIDFVVASLNCEEPCIVRYNGGGYLAAFREAAHMVQGGARKSVIIDGECISACALFADLARPHVCITEHAVFKFHKAVFLPTQTRFDPDHSTDIARWVNKHGGFPREGFLEMRISEARRFWPVCKA